MKGVSIVIFLVLCANVHSQNKFVIEPEKRPLHVGDSFTPREMIPVAKKLMAKMKHVGRGKGIISSATDHNKLAEDIFRGFFLTSSMIVILNRNDIVGLDALQSLALAGAPSDTPEAILEGNYRRRSNGTQELYSQFKVLTKPVNKEKRRDGRDSKKRLLKVQVRHHGKVYKEKKNAEAATPFTPHKAFFYDKKKPSDCVFRYYCHNIGRIDTCRLHEHCGNDEGNVIDGIVLDREDEKTEKLMEFREKIGICIVDEEVEKIFERRRLQIMPNVMRVQKESDSVSNAFNHFKLPTGRPEGVHDYFNKVIVAERKRSTKPSADDFTRWTTPRSK